MIYAAPKDFEGDLDMAEPAERRPRPTHYLYQDVTRQRASGRVGLRIVGAVLVLVVLGGVAGCIAVGTFLWGEGRSPREWAAYLSRSAGGQSQVVTGAALAVSRWLVRSDRLAFDATPPVPVTAGASEQRSGDVPAGRLRVVASISELADAVGDADPGDVITLQPGRYPFTGATITARRPGSPGAPVTVRAARLGDAVIDSDASEALKLLAPYWRIENLVIRGTCADHARCAHAVHVAGGATDVVIRNNRFEDFNAQIKVNGEDGAFPDRGVIEGNTLIDNTPRDTGDPVTPVDLVAASDWRIRGNFIADFVRAGPDGPTYGAFAKGAGENNVMERNVIVCEWRLHGIAGQHIGLSLGGGGTGEAYRREQGATGFEHVGGAIQDNLIAACSDDGIYLNRAARSVIDHNTILDTAGVDARFLESSARVTRNMIDGTVRARDGAVLDAWENDSPWFLGLFVGWHPQRGYFRDPARLDLTWRDGSPESLEDTAARPDLCGKARAAASPAGAFTDFAPCMGKTSR